MCTTSLKTHEPPLPSDENVLIYFCHVDVGFNSFFNIKKSAFLQSSDINFLTAVEIIESLKKFLVSMRNTEENFTDIYHNTIKMSQHYEIKIPQLKKIKVPTKIDCSNIRY